MCVRVCLELQNKWAHTSTLQMIIDELRLMCNNVLVNSTEVAALCLLQKIRTGSTWSSK